MVDFDFQDPVSIMPPVSFVTLASLELYGSKDLLCMPGNAPISLQLASSFRLFMQIYFSGILSFFASFSIFDSLFSLECDMHLTIDVH